MNLSPWLWRALWCVYLLKWWMLIDFKQLSRLLKFIGLLKFETCVYCWVHIFEKFIFYYFRCDMYFLQSNKTTFSTGWLLNSLFCHIYTQAQGATPSHTKPHLKLLENFDRTPSRRGHGTPRTNTPVWKRHMGKNPLLFVEQKSEAILI